MRTQRTDRPQTAYASGTGVGWTGYNSLMAAGSHLGMERAFSRNVIYTDLHIPVSEHTQFSYMIFPAMARDNFYDFDYTSMYMALDLAFTDGSYLSELSALDQNGNRLTARSQGESNALYYLQWNQILSHIGQVAAGKTISQILVVYDKPAGTEGMDAPFLSYFDDILIEDKVPVTYEHLYDYVNILRGSQSNSGYFRGNTSPS